MSASGSEIVITAPPPGPCRRPDPAPLRLDQPLTDGQPHAGTAHAVRPLDPVELVEDAFLVLRWDADAAVSHRNFHCLVCSLGRHLNA